MIIHCAAEKSVEECEKNKESSKHLNTELTEFLARYCKEYGAWLLYISTDYVFDGKNAPYKPNSTTNPLNLYGKLKLDGEIKARSADWGVGVLRVPVLYGKVEHLKESVVTSLLQQVKKKKKSVKIKKK